MRFFVLLLLTAVLSVVTGLYFPWWSIAPAAFIAGLLVQVAPWKSFLAGFLGVFLSWGALALWIDTKNNHLLSHKVAEIFPLGGSGFLLIMLTALIGGLVGGFAALSAGLIKKR